MANRYTYRPPCSSEKLRGLYSLGMTQIEIAHALGVTQKIVWKAMLRFGIQARPAAARNQKGSRNNNWGGSDVTYAAFHKRVEVEKGRPRCCELCGTTDSNRTYEWANMTGHYDDPSDYKRLCRQCHRRVDAARREAR